MRHLLSDSAILLNNLSAPIRRIGLVMIQFFNERMVGIACGVLSILYCLVLMEFYFRYFPDRLPHALGNYIASGYNVDISGIYF
jgi:hypothetical protein